MRIFFVGLAGLVAGERSSFVGHHPLIFHQGVRQMTYFLKFVVAGLEAGFLQSPVPLTAE
jgi:hypothetical protein